MQPQSGSGWHSSHYPPETTAGGMGVPITGPHCPGNPGLAQNQGLSSWNSNPGSSVWSNSSGSAEAPGIMSSSVHGPPASGPHLSWTQSGSSFNSTSASYQPPRVDQQLQGHGQRVPFQGLVSSQHPSPQQGVPQQRYPPSTQQGYQPSSQQGFAAWQEPQCHGQQGQGPPQVPSQPAGLNMPGIFPSQQHHQQQQYPQSSQDASFATPPSTAQLSLPSQQPPPTQQQGWQGQDNAYPISTPTTQQPPGNHQPLTCCTGNHPCFPSVGCSSSQNMCQDQQAATFRVSNPQGPIMPLPNPPPSLPAPRPPRQTLSGAVNTHPWNPPLLQPHSQPQPRPQQPGMMSTLLLVPKSVPAVQQSYPPPYSSSASQYPSSAPVVRPPNPTSGQPGLQQQGWYTGQVASSQGSIRSRSSFDGPFGSGGTHPASMGANPRGNNAPPLQFYRWAREEDRILLVHVKQYGTRQWTRLTQSSKLPNRDNKACCNRFLLLKRKFLEEGGTVEEAKGEKEAGAGASDKLGSDHSEGRKDGLESSPSPTPSPSRSSANQKELLKKLKESRLADDSRLATAMLIAHDKAAQEALKRSSGLAQTPSTERLGTLPSLPYPPQTGPPLPPSLSVPMLSCGIPYAPNAISNAPQQPSNPQDVNSIQPQAPFPHLPTLPAPPPPFSSGLVKQEQVHGPGQQQQLPSHSNPSTERFPTTQPSHNSMQGFHGAPVAAEQQFTWHTQPLGPVLSSRHRNTTGGALTQGPAPSQQPHEHGSANSINRVKPEPRSEPEQMQIPSWPPPERFLPAQHDGATTEDSSNYLRPPSLCASLTDAQQQEMLVSIECQGRQPCGTWGTTTPSAGGPMWQGQAATFQTSTGCEGAAPHPALSSPQTSGTAGNSEQVRGKPGEREEVAGGQCWQPREGGGGGGGVRRLLIEENDEGIGSPCGRKRKEMESPSPRDEAERGWAVSNVQGRARSAPALHAGESTPSGSFNSGSMHGGSCWSESEVNAGQTEGDKTAQENKVTQEDKSTVEDKRTLEDKNAHVPELPEGLHSNLGQVHEIEVKPGSNFARSRLPFHSLVQGPLATKSEHFEPLFEDFEDKPASRMNNLTPQGYSPVQHQQAKSTEQGIGYQGLSYQELVGIADALDDSVQADGPFLGSGYDVKTENLDCDDFCDMHI